MVAAVVVAVVVVRAAGFVLLQIALEARQEVTKAWRVMCRSLAEKPPGDVDDVVSRMPLAKQRVPMGHLVLAPGGLPTIQPPNLVPCTGRFRRALPVSSRPDAVPIARLHSASCARIVFILG